MKKYLYARIFQLFVVMLGASLLTFSVTYLAPSDPAEMMFMSKDVIPTAEALNTAREAMGLNKPFIMQYMDWLLGICKGDLGYSYTMQMPVADMLGMRLVKTLELSLFAIAILFALSIVLGVISAVKKNSFADILINVFSAVSISIPSFWLGLIMMFVFVVKLHIFKITSSEGFSAMVLPAVTLAFPLVGRYTKQIRGAVLDEINSNYVVGAVARGVNRKRILFFHILPNTLLSITTLFGMTVAALLGGTAIVENIFSWPGLGTMALDAITYRDYTLLQAYVILMCFIYVGINFIVDVLTHIIDPRIEMFGKEVQSE
ncbi:MAG: ABC transporter permease [Clostridia bacterium]|nr:ABC transporter permease [Clostridia bacterium]